MSYLIDNPWSNALDRSKAAGLVLADTLLHRHVGVRPVSLIGFSLGARAIFYALAELARVKAFGIVQDVYLFGATVTASKQKWLDVRGVVSGRFVNAYARSDWVLGYLFRATSGGNTVAGLRPIEDVPRLENIDITDKIAGHLSYRPMMPLLLHSVGLPVTADYFDEPVRHEACLLAVKSLTPRLCSLVTLQEEPEFVEDRIVMTEEEEEARRAAKKSWFGRSKKAKSGSGLSSPAVTSRPPSIDQGRKPGETPPDYDEDADDLPPQASLEKSAPAGPSKLRLSFDGSEKRRSSTASSTALALADTSGTESPSAALPMTAGFDFAAISRALGKDIDLDSLKAPAAGPQSAALPPVEVKPPLARFESTPPSAEAFDDPASSLWAKSSPPSSNSHAASSMHDLSRLSLDTTIAPAEEDSWSSPGPLAPSSISYDTNAWGTGSSPYRTASASSSAALPSFSSLHKPSSRGFSHHLPPPDEPVMTFGGSDGTFSRSKEDELDDPWNKPLARPVTGGFSSNKGVIDNPWG